MKIAWFTPFNTRSAIGHYSEAIAGELSKTEQIVVFASDADAPGPRRSSPLPVVYLGDGSHDLILRQLEGFDAVVYNMGNFTSYKRVYEILLRRPGVVVLHDLVMRDFFRGYFMGEKRAPLVLARLMAYGGGPQAEELSQGFLKGRCLDAPDDPTRLQFPMFQSALHRCLGVVVHSEYSRARVAAACPAPVEKLDFPLFGPAAEHAKDKWPRPRRPAA